MSKRHKHRTRHHFCRQGVALASTRQLRLQGPAFVHAHRTEGVTESEGRERANGVRGGIGLGVRNGDGNRGGDVSVDGGGDGARRRAGVEANEGTKYGNGDGSKDGNESSSGDGNGDEDGNGNGNEDGIGEGGGEAGKRKKPHKSCRRDVGNRGDLGGKRKRRRQERFGSVPAHPDNLENSKEAGGEAQYTQGLSKNCTSRERMSLSRV